LTTPSFSKLTAILILVVSGIISWLIANIGVNTGNMEMAAIANVFFPPAIAVISIILFLLLDWLIKNGRFWITLVLFLATVLSGLVIRIENVCC
jgi:hypothetical protein